MSSFLRFIVIISFTFVAIVSSAKIPPKEHPMEPAKPTEYQFLIQLLCRINKLEAEAKEIQSDYLQLLHEGLHVPEDKVLALNKLADDFHDYEPEPIVGKPHNSGAQSWVRAFIKPIDSPGNRNSTDKRSMPDNKNKFSKFRFH